MREMIEAQDMQLGDIVDAFPQGEGGYQTATVIQIKDGYATLFRPYITTSDFSYTGGVIPYIGTETYPVALDGRPVVRFRKGEVK